MTASLAGFNELYDLVGDQCEGRLTVGQVLRIEELVLGDAEQRRRYILCMHTQGQIEAHRQKRVDDLLLADGGRDQEDPGCGPISDALPAQPASAQCPATSSVLPHPSSFRRVRLAGRRATVVCDGGGDLRRRPWGLGPGDGPSWRRNSARNDAIPSRGSRQRCPGRLWRRSPNRPAATGPIRVRGATGTGVALDSCFHVPAGRLEITYNMERGC